MSEGVNGGVMKWNWYETVKKNVKKKEVEKNRRALLCLCFQLNWTFFSKLKRANCYVLLHKYCVNVLFVCGL